MSPPSRPRKAFGREERKSPVEKRNQDAKKTPRQENTQRGVDREIYPARSKRVKNVRLRTSSTSAASWAIDDDRAFLDPDHVISLEQTSPN